VEYETKNMMSIIYFETLNIEWGQIDPKGDRRVKTVRMPGFREAYREDAVFLFEPGPVGGQRVAVAHADQQPFVVLVAVLRVLVGGDVGKSYSRRRDIQITKFKGS